MGQDGLQLIHIVLISGLSAALAIDALIALQFDKFAPGRTQKWDAPGVCFAINEQRENEARALN
jgi:hypothetical protein